MATLEICTPDAEAKVPFWQRRHPVWPCTVPECTTLDTIAIKNLSLFNIFSLVEKFKAFDMNKSRAVEFPHASRICSGVKNSFRQKSSWCSYNHLRCNGNIECASQTTTHIMTRKYIKNLALTCCDLRSSHILQASKRGNSSRLYLSTKKTRFKWKLIFFVKEGR